MTLRPRCCAVALIGCALVLGCGRTKPVGRARPTIAARCQCDGKYCFLVGEQHVGRTRICLTDGTFRDLTEAEVDTVVCSEARCSGYPLFCKASADVSCLAPNAEGTAADPEELAKFAAECNTQCGTLGLRQHYQLADGSELTVYSECFGGGAAQLETVKCGPAASRDPDPIPFFSPAFTSEADVLATSQAVVDFLDNDGKVVESATAAVEGGGIHLVPDNCPVGTCSVTAWLGFRLGTFVGQGHAVANAAVVSEGPLTGSLDAQGTLSIPAAQFLVSGAIDGSGRAADFSNAVPMMATIDRATGNVALELALSGDSMRLTANVVAHLNRTPPVPVISGETQLECSSPDGTAAHLDGYASTDREGKADLREFMWYRSALTLGAPAAVAAGFEPRLALGDTDVVLRAIDRAGKEGSAQRTLHVVDTQPPEITGAEFVPPCLWPPSHEFVLFELGAHMEATVSDACSPLGSLRVSIVDVTSSEAQSRTGSGNQNPDAVFGSGAMCLRAERSGAGAGREYVVTLKVEDPQGNSSTREFTVNVPHDMRPQSRCDASPPGDRFLASTDVRCTAAVQTSPVKAVVGGGRAVLSRPSQQGPSCSTAPSPVEGYLALIVLLILVRPASTRVPRRARHALVLAMLAWTVTACAKPPSESCLSGWWAGQSTTCKLPCGQQNQPPECALADCEVLSMLRLGPDRTSTTASVTLAPSARQFSTWGPKSSSTWSLEGDQLRKSEGAVMMQVTCTPSRLTLDGQMLQRVEADLALALDAAGPEQDSVGVKY